MSDHDHHDEPNNLLAGLVGKIFYLLIPFSLVVMLGIVGAAFLKGGGYRAEAPAPYVEPKPPGEDDPVPPDPTVMELGKTTFAMCQACHGADGQGMQMGPQKMAPSLVGSELLLGNPEAGLLAVHKGIVKEAESPYVGQMVGLGAGLDDQKIAAVLTYVRNSFGNKASEVTAKQSAEVRKKHAAAAAFKRADLEEMAKQ